MKCFITSWNAVGIAGHVSSVMPYLLFPATFQAGSNLQLGPATVAWQHKLFVLSVSWADIESRIHGAIQPVPPNPCGTLFCALLLSVMFLLS